MDKSKPAFPLMAEDPTATDLVNVGAASYPPGRVIFPAAVQPGVPAWARQARGGGNSSRKFTTCGFRTTADPQDKSPNELV